MACGLPLSALKIPSLGGNTAFQVWVNSFSRRMRLRRRGKTGETVNTKDAVADAAETDHSMSTDMIADTEIDGADEQLLNQLSPDDAYLSCLFPLCNFCFEPIF